ncbi:MAG: T9SS type A sorting domain-containing protein [Flavobacteriales bacterium]|jgi:hypothetical protein|nr:T9SS type A sorting domain-containing protein [Flavobacteriales bacterium]
MIKSKFTFITLILTLCLSNYTAQTANFEWAKTFVTDTTASTISSALGVATDANGNVYTCGWFAGIVDFDINGAAGSQLTASGPTDIFITKHDATGNFQWVKQIGSTGRDEATAITVDSNGDLIIGGTYRYTVDFDPNAGTTNLTNASGTEDIFLLKLDAGGNFLWAKSIEGVTSVEYVYDISTDASGNVYTTGNYTGTLDLDPGTGVSNTVWAGAQDVFIQKLDANGNFQWGKRIGSSGGDFGITVTSDNSGNVYLCGFFSNTIDLDPGNGVVLVSSAGSADGYLLKLDANGDYVSSHTFGGSGPDSYSSMAFDSNNNLVLCGYFSDNVDFDPTSGTSMQTANNTDIFVQKIDANGNLLWVKTSTSPGFNLAWGLKIDANNSIYMTSRFGGNLSLDNTQTLSSNGGNDIVLEKLSSTGSLVWAVSYGGLANDTPSDIALTTSGDIYTAGDINSTTVDFDPTSGVQILNGNGNQNQSVGFLQKISQGSCTPTSGTDIQTACDSFDWIDGNTYTSSNNTATHTLTNAAGCDSVVTLDLIITNSTSSVFSTTACNSYTWIDGITYTSSNNTATYTLTNTAGCDSVITLNLNINTVDTATSVTGATITSSQQGAGYLWVDCDNNFTPANGNGQSTQIFTPAINGNYAVIVSNNGCSERSSCVSINTVGLNELLSNGITLSPNPTADNIRITSSEILDNVTIYVTDAKGSVISTNQFDSLVEEYLELGDAPGVYFITVQKEHQISRIRCIKN